MQKSDVITLHCPLFPETKHMINKDSIAKMKDGVLLVNTSRGGLINTEDLLVAVKAGKFRGVGLDVCEKNMNISMKTEAILQTKTLYCKNYYKMKELF